MSIKLNTILPETDNVSLKAKLTVEDDTILNDGKLVFTSATGNNYIQSTSASLTQTDNSVIFSGYGNTDAWTSINNSQTKIFPTTASTSTSTGALVVDGGAGVAGSLNVGGITRIFNTSEQSLILSGGMTSSKNIISKNIIASQKQNIAIEDQTLTEMNTGQFLQSQGSGFSYVQNQYIQLTSNGNSQRTSVYWEQTPGNSISAKFDIFYGGGTGADGISFGFYQQAINTDVYTNSGGILVIFGELNNSIRVSIPGETGTLLSTYTNLVPINTWRTVQVVYTLGKIYVYISGVLVGQRTFKHPETVANATDTFIRFTASNGSLNNNHRIRNIEITKDAKIDQLIPGELKVLSGSVSSSSSTGGLVVAGGVGVGGDVNIAGDITIQGTINASGITGLTHSELLGLTSDDHTQYALLTGRTSGQTIIGGTASGANLVLASTSNATKGNIRITETTSSSSTTTGALVVSGGVGVGGSLYLFGDSVIANNRIRLVGDDDGINYLQSGTTSTSSSSAELRIGPTFTNGHWMSLTSVRVNITRTTASTSTTTGALVVAGGVGIAGALNVGGATVLTGNLTVNGITGVSHSELGGLLVDDHTQYALLAGRTSGQTIIGGTASGANLVLASTSNATKGSVRITETTSSFSTTTGALTVSGGVGIGGALNATEVNVANGLVMNYNRINGSDLKQGVIEKRYALTSSANFANEQLFTSEFLEKTPELVERRDIITIQDTFSNRICLFKGLFYVSVADVYTFGTNSDDCSDIFVDGKLVADWYGLHAANGTTTQPGGNQRSINLGVGYHIIITRLGQALEGVILHTLWKNSTDANFSVIPGSILYYDPKELLSATADDVSVLNNLTLRKTTASTSSTTGTLVVAGGVGIAGALNVGGTSRITNTTDSTSATTGALVVSGGAGIGGPVWIGYRGNSVPVLSLTRSDGNTGADFSISATNVLRINSQSGGDGRIDFIAGIAGIYFSFGFDGSSTTRPFGITSSTASTTTTTGALTVSGGVGVGGAMNVGGTLRITNTTDSTSATTGALVVSGGAGIGGPVWIGHKGDSVPVLSLTRSDGNIGANFSMSGVANFSILRIVNPSSADGRIDFNAGTNGNYFSFGFVNGSSTTRPFGITSNTASTSTSTGALTVSGGVGIAGALNVGGNTVLAGNLTVNGSLSGASHSDLGNLNVDDHAQYALLSGRTSGQTITGGTASGANLVLTSTSNATKGSVRITETTASTSSTTGALTVSGGIGLAGDLNVGSGIGIGISARSGQLLFNNLALNRRVVLFEDTNNDHQYYGFGINPSVLRYQTGSVAADHVFYAGTGTTTSVELFRVKGNGNVGIGINPTFKLDVSGTTRISGITSITNSTASTSKTSGALVVSGGIGISGRASVNNISIVDTVFPETHFNFINTGENYIRGTRNFFDSNDTRIRSADASTILVGITPTNFNIPISTASTSPITGALTVSGGVGIGGWLNIDGSVCIRQGNLADVFIRDQLTFGFNNTTTFKHAIKTRHNEFADNHNNAFDFYVWQTTDANTDIGTKNAMSITSSGVGIGGINNPLNTLDVNGSSRIRGNLLVGSSSSSNHIAFRGTTGDGDGLFDHTFIGERIYGGTEQSELLLIKANDRTPPSGPERIRLLGGEICFDTFTDPVALNNTFEQMAALGTRRMTIANDGTVNILATTASTGPTSGALTVAGGVGIGGGIVVGYQGDEVPALTLQRVDNTGAINLSVTGTTNGTTTLQLSNLSNAEGRIDFDAGAGGVYFSFGAINGSSTTKRFRITDTTSSTSTTSGALTVSGGVGIGGNLYIDGEGVIANNRIRMLGDITGINYIQSGTTSTSSSSAELRIGPTFTTGHWMSLTSTRINITPTTASTSTTTGALTVAGGVGIAGALNVGGTTNISQGSFLNFITGNVGAPTTTTRSIGTRVIIWSDLGPSTADYAIGISDFSQWYSVPSNSAFHRFYHGTANTATLSASSLSLAPTTASTSTTTGALTVAGGVGIGGALNVGGTTRIYNTTESIDPASGAFAVAGGVGIGEALSVGGRAVIYRNVKIRGGKTITVPALVQGIVRSTFALSSGSNMNSEPLLRSEYVNKTITSSTVATNMTLSGVANNIVYLFQGILFIDTEGTYTFGVNSDDASDIYVNGRLVADWYGSHVANIGFIPGGNQVSVFLTVGYYTISSKYANAIGSSSNSALWRPPAAGSFVSIPDSVLFHVPADIRTTPAYNAQEIDDIFEDISSQSTSRTSGAVVIGGGLGITGNINALGIRTATLSPNDEVVFFNLIGSNLSPYGFGTGEVGFSSRPWFKMHAGEFNVISDRRSKTDITDYVQGLSFITLLSPKKYTYKRGNVSEKIGFIAQEVLEINPGFQGVNYDEKEDIYTMTMDQFIAPLVNSVKELNDELISTKAELLSLKAEFQKLKEMVITLI